MFKKGNPGGPGRPKKAPLIAPVIREILSDPVELRKFAQAIVDQAAAGGNPKSIDKVFYALDGPIEQKFSIDQTLTALTPAEKLEMLLMLEAENGGESNDGESNDGESDNDG